MKSRFAGKLSNDYSLLVKAIPHYHQFEKRMIGEIANHYKPNNGFRALEIGSGTGITARKFLEYFVRARLTSIDIEPAMIEQSLVTLDKYSERTDLITTDALNFLTFQKNDSFDVIFSCWTIHNFENPYRNQILREIFRVLKPNGLFVNGDICASDDDAVHRKNVVWLISQYDIFDKIERQDLKDEITRHIKQDNLPNRIMREEKLLRTLKEIGFRNIKTSKRIKTDLIITCQK